MGEFWYTMGGLVIQCQDCQTAEPLEEDRKDTERQCVCSHGQRKDTPLKVKGNFTNCKMHSKGQNNLLLHSVIFCRMVSGKG